MPPRRSSINQVSLRQAITPQRMQGRLNATMRFIVWGTIPVGGLVGGVLGSTVGLHQAIWVGAIGSLLPFLFVLFSPVRSIRAMPGSDHDASTTSVRGLDARRPEPGAADDGVVTAGHSPLIRPDH